MRLSKPIHQQQFQSSFKNYCYKEDCDQKFKQSTKTARGLLREIMDEIRKCSARHTEFPTKRLLFGGIVSNRRNPMRPQNGFISIYEIIRIDRCARMQKHRTIRYVRDNRRFDLFENDQRHMAHPLQSNDHDT